MSESEVRELVVIGGGPGGYPAAFQAAGLGMDVTLIDSEAALGGVCLHRGCIPSKALLHAADSIRGAEAAATFGVAFEPPKIDVTRLREWKESVVTRLAEGLSHLARQNKVHLIRGRARFADATTLIVTREGGGEERIRFKAAIMATGSQPAMLPLAPPSPRVMDSTAALELIDIPERLLVIGGGYIGLELGQAYAAFGSRVTIVEKMPTLLAGVDHRLVRALSARLQREFEAVMIETRALALEADERRVTVRLADREGRETTGVYDRVLIAVGRRPNTADLGLEHTRVKLDDGGFVVTDGQRRTAEPAIFAVGDAAGQPMLAHKATHEGKVAVEALAGRKSVFEPQAIPAVVFTRPEIAWTGLDEDAAVRQGIKVTAASFPWTASGRAATLGDKEGLTRLVLEKGSGRVLGAGIVGPGAGELINEATLAIEMGAVAEDLAHTIHPHPTLGETLMEAAGGWR